jgi:hypothetical protein
VIRSEAIPVSLLRGTPQLRNVYGFCFNPNVDGDTLAAASVATIRADVEYADGRMTWLALRSGQLVGTSGRLMTRVWLTNASDGVLGLDVAYDPDDKLVPNPSAPLAQPVMRDDVVIHPNGTVIGNLQLGNWLRSTFERPSWAKGAALSIVCAGGYNITGAVAPFFVVEREVESAPGDWSPYADNAQLLMVADHRQELLASFGVQTPARWYGLPPPRIRLSLGINNATASVTAKGLPVVCRWVG